MTVVDPSTIRAHHALTATEDDRAREVRRERLGWLFCVCLWCWVLAVALEVTAR